MIESISNKLLLKRMFFRLRKKEGMPLKAHLEKLN